MSTFSGILSGTSDAAEQVFDYIMNTQPAYKKLGEAVKMLEREAAETEKYTGVRTSASDELNHDMYPSAHGAHSKWERTVFDAVRLARADYRKSFPHGEGGFMQQKMMETVNVFDIMKLALQHRDRFDGLGAMTVSKGIAIYAGVGLAAVGGIAAWYAYQSGITDYNNASANQAKRAAEQAAADAAEALKYKTYNAGYNNG